MPKKGYIILLIGLLLIGVILVGISYISEKETTSGKVKPIPTPTETKTIKITASDLFEEYKTNEIAADNKYKNRIVTIVDLIEDISRDPTTNEPYVDVDKVRCFFKNDNELLKLAKGQEIVVKGICLGKKVEKEKTTFPIIFKDCSLIEETEFELIGWQVGSGGPRAYLEITYKKFGYSLTLTLLDPKGEEISATEVGYSWTEVSEWKNRVFSTLPLTKTVYENPMAGEYKLAVEDVKGDVVATETFNFSGPDPEVKITEASGHWENDIVSSWYDSYEHKYKPVYGKEYHYSFSFMIDMKNTGDLPFYSQSIIVKSPNDDFAQGSYEYKIALAPNEEKNVSLSTEYYQQYETLTMQGYKYMRAGPKNLYFRSPGEKILTLEFWDGTGKVAYSMSTTITVPEKPPV